MTARVLLALLLAAAARADVVVTSSGQVLEGSADVDLPGRTVRVGRKTIPLDEAWLVERDDGALVYAPDFDARLRGYEHLARRHLRGEYVRILRETIHVDDFALARRCLEQAESMGLSSREAAKLKRRIEREEGRRMGAGRRVKSERLAARARELDGYFGDLLARRAETALQRGKDGARLVRAALRRRPGSELAGRLLGEIAPEQFPLGDARTWLEWHLDLEEAGARLRFERSEALARARHLWRPDLHAVEADPILIVTPVVDSYLVGRMLSYGRLACAALADLFATDAPARTPDHLLTVFLFGSKKEYLTTTGTGHRVEVPASLEWTAGHYSPAEGVSRFYWFRDPDAERRIVGTCMHELTHHWLNERNPRAVPAPGRDGQPGFWIVEGFATFMEEGVYDVESGTYDLFNPRCRSLDVMHVISPRECLPWGDFYALNQGGFHGLPGEDRSTLALRWNLYVQVLSSRRLFYEQAAATCHFLYHADAGKYRARLLDYVVDWYSGRSKRLGIRAAFGMDARELGKRTVEFAHAVAKGWQPDAEER